MNPSSWYYARNEEKHVRQIVFKLSPESRIGPQADILTADAAFSAPNWAVTAVLDSPSAVPVIFAKATGAIEIVDHKPADVAFAFYHLEHGGVFQIFVQVDSPAVRSKFGYPFLAEHARWLDETNDRRIIEALIAGQKIELCFVAPGEKGPFTPFFGLSGNVPPDCCEKLKQEWNELLRHHDSIELKDFQSALQQYNQENPMEESPVLAPPESGRPEVPSIQDQELSPETLGALFQALSSNDVKDGDILEIKRNGTVEVDQGGLGLTEYDIVELYNHGMREVGDIELTQGVYEMAQTALELGAERQLSAFAADLIKQKEQKKKRTQKPKPRRDAKAATSSIRKTLIPIQTQRLVLVPSLIALSLNLFGLFVTQWALSTYIVVNCCLIVAVGVYFAFRLDRAGAWPPEKSKTQNSGEELGSCIGGLFVVGIVLGVLVGALKLSNTIMLPIGFAILCIYGLFQLAVYPRLSKALLLFTVIAKLPELVGSLLLPTGVQTSPVRVLNILGLSVVMPIYATWVGMITAAVLAWRKDRRGVLTSVIDERQTGSSNDTAQYHYQRGIENSERQNWKEAATDFATAVELDRSSPTYLYSLAVAKTKCAPNDLGEEQLQKYYLDVCALFEKAIGLDTNRSELDREAYKKVAYTGGALYRSLKKHEDALRLFRVGLKHYSNDPELLAGVGWSQFDLGQLSDAEKTVSRLLELAPDSDDGRQLWKAIRKAQGLDLTSDLSEDLKRKIYKEYLEQRDRAFVQGYTESGVSANLSFEELVSDISGKSADAESKVRRFLLEKYGLNEFEFDLILKQGEREAWD